MAPRVRIRVPSRSALRLVGDPILSQASRALAPGEVLPPSLLRRMRKCLTSEGAAEAISAVQVGEPVRAIMIAKADDASAPPRLLLNPRIVKQSKRREADWESCLSVPDYCGLVLRAHRVMAAYETAEGETVERNLSGYAYTSRFHRGTHQLMRLTWRGRFAARVFQHEVDHLDGIVFTEKALPRSLGHLSSLATPARRDALRKEVLRDLPNADLSEAEREVWDTVSLWECVGPRQ